MTTATVPRRRLFVVVAALLLLVVAAVVIAVTVRSDPGRREVTFILDFSPQGRHAPFYMALFNGHYDDAGLDVTFVRGQGDLFAVQTVAGGQATLGSAMPMTIIEARSRDVDITSVMVYEAGSPLSFAVWKGTGIESPADFAGHTYGGNPFAAANRILPVFLEYHGVDPSTIEEKTVDPSALVPSFLAGEFDITPAFHDATWPIYEREGPSVGREAVEFLLSDWGFDLLGYSVFALDSTVEDDPTLIADFVEATIRGYEDAARSPGEAVEAILAAEPTLNRDLLLVQVTNALGLMETDRYGYASDQAMEDTLDVVSSAYGITGVTVTDVFTNAFIP